MSKRGICGRIDVVMIAGLFQKVKEILTGNKFEKEDEEGRGFQRAVQRHDVVMCRKGLVDGCL
jgi:hypothetical protein